MNKDVIYVEPEDDITDIISKLESAKEKIIALIPPKKAGVLRSIVNIKLIHKTATASGKTVVLVTNDQSIIKLAATVRIPVTKDLQTAPHIPTSKDINDDDESDETIVEEVVEGEDNTIIVKNNTITDEAEEKKEKSPKKITVSNDDSADESKIVDSVISEIKAEEENANNEPKKGEKPSKTSKEKLGIWFHDHKKMVTICSSIIGVLVIILIWALLIAPSVTINIKVRTTSNNFSEVVSFTEKQTEEKAEEGKFYLETLKTESPIKIEFEATGSKNVGNRATGQLIIYTRFSAPGQVAISNNAMFIYNNNSYSLQEDSVIAWDGAINACENDFSNINDSCMISITVDAVATEGGARFNAPASETGWVTPIPNISAYTNTGFEGGTDKTITVVQQSDVENAKKQITIISEDDSKEKLNDQMTDDRIAVRNTFKQETSAITIYPNIGEEIPENEKPYISINTIATMYAIDKTSVETFIREKARLNEDYKIYTMNDPYVENFLATDDGFIGKLKTSYTSGPKITENELVERIKGHRLGDVQHDLKSVDGISEIKIEKSFPWVFSVPNDSNKITINLIVEE